MISDPRFLIQHEAVIYLLSAALSLFFGLAVFTLRRRARTLQEKKWATPFALAFYVLACIHSLRFLVWLIEGLASGDWKDITEPIIIIVYLCSGVTNYLFFLSAFRLSEPAVDKPRLLPLKRWLTGSVYVRGALFLLLCLAGLMQVAGGWLRVFDDIFSVLALFSMGFALYQHIDPRRDRLMAWIALLSSSGYAVLVLLHGFGLVPPRVAFLSSMPLKFGLFFPAYSLMQLLSGPLQGIERMLENVTRKQNEYLDGGGIVKSICEELPLKRVNLVIKLPGTAMNQIALYTYPPTSNGSNDQEPLKFDYGEGTAYDRVMKSGQAEIRNRDDKRYSVIRRMAEVTVPIFFHNSVIACLHAEIGEEKFTEADLSNLKRITTMISPAVQAYRDMAALSKASQDLAQYQIGVVRYKIEHDVEQITEIIRDVVSPSAAGIHIKIGFLEFLSTYPQTGHLGKSVRELMAAEHAEEDMIDRDGEHCWLTKELKIPMVSPTGEKVDEQDFGRIIFGIERAKNGTRHPTIGMNRTCRRALSDLITDTLLDFIRGHLNQLTDDLGAGLSGLKGTTPDDWRKEVQKTAQEAKLPWAVASFSDENRFGPDEDKNNLLGERETVELVKSLECAEQKERWKMKDEGLWLYSLDQPQAGACHVIKKALKKSQAMLSKTNKNAQATLWLGVERPGFGRELDYVSPWKYFLDHFCEIADSALLRILNEEQEEERNKRMIEFQSMAMTTITTGNALHELSNLAVALTTPVIALEVAVRDGRLQCSDDLKELILSLRVTRSRIQDLLRLFYNAMTRNERRPCSLDEALAHVCQKAENSWKERGIKIVPPKPSGAMIDVPFHAAIFALDVIFDNAKDAILGHKTRTGRIRIKAHTTPEEVVCEITDSGPGVPDEVRKTLLKKVTRSDKPNSNGVGLYLSVFLLRGYGGDITLAPREHRAGATFRIHFRKSSTPLIAGVDETGCLETDAMLAEA